MFFNKIKKMPKRSLLIIMILFIIFFTSIIFYLVNNKVSEKPLVLNEQNIVLYIKSNCVYCQMAKQILKDNNFAFEVIELTNNRDLHLKMIKKTGQATVPYVYIEDQLIGGYTDLDKWLTSRKN